MTTDSSNIKPMTHGTTNGITNGGTNGHLKEYLVKRSDLHDRMTKDSSGKSVIEWYDGEATLYDDQFEHANFIYHKDTAQALADYVKDRGAKVLDLAAGSGKIGLLLKGHGFCNMDALDGSSGMLKLAKEKGIYQKYLHCMVDSKKIPEVDDASYDAVSCGGSVAKGHLSYDTIQTMLRAVKPGGYLIFSCAGWNFQFEEFSRTKLDDCFSELKKRGLCATVEERPSFHIGEEPGFIFILRRGDGVLNGH